MLWQEFNSTYVCRPVSGRSNGLVFCKELHRGQSYSYSVATSDTAAKALTRVFDLQQNKEYRR